MNYALYLEISWIKSSMNMLMVRYASQRRVLMTKWVGEAWSTVGKMKDSIIRSFKKCGLSVALDGSDDEGESEKEDEDKGNAENEEELEILIH